jgi:hypothetical protein
MWHRFFMTTVMFVRDLHLHLGTIILAITILSTSLFFVVVPYMYIIVLV